MARNFVQPIAIREGLQPQGEVVSTYVRPADFAPSPLHSLASALSSFSKDVKGFLNKRQQDQAKGADVRGKAAAMKANGLGYDEAVKQGLIKTYESPEFITGYKATQGEIMGKRLASQFATEYQTWGGRNSQNPEDFDNFLGEFMRKNLTTDDPEVLAGAIPYLEQVRDAGYNLNATERSNALYNDSIDASVASSSMDVDTAIDLSIASGAEPEYDSLWTQLLAQREATLQHGVLEDDYDKAFTVMIAQKSVEYRDPALLGLLNNKVPGKDFTYAATPEGAKLVATAISSLEESNLADERLRVKAQEDADKAEMNDNTALAIDQLAQDPNHVFDEEFLDRASTLDPTFKLKVREWSKTLAAGEPEDESAILALQVRILRGEIGVEEIGNEMLEGGSIKTSATATKLYNLAQTAGNEALRPLFDNETYKAAMSSIGKSLTPSDDWLEDPTKPNNSVIAAQLDYQQSMIAWARANPELATDYGAVATQSATVLARIQKGFGVDEATGSPEYATPQEVAKPEEGGLPAPAPLTFDGRPAPDTGVPDNPLAPTQQELLNEEAASPAPDDFEVWRGEVPPTADQLNEKQRMGVEEQARRLGVPVDQYIERLYQNLKGNLPEQTTKDGQPLPQGEEGDGEPPDPQDVSSITPEELEEFRSRQTEFAAEAGIELASYTAPTDYFPEEEGYMLDPKFNPSQSTVAEVKKVAPLLNILGGSEGTDKGEGYNETLAYGAYVDGKKGGKKVKVDLVNMTLKEVRALQRTMLKDPDNKWNSSAVGRYQIVGVTLSRLMKRMGLTGNEKFTPELQDRMALELMRGRGLDKWLAGKMTDAAFMANVAKEWASVPKIDGSKTYKGQGLGVTPKKVLAALKQMKPSATA